MSNARRSGQGGAPHEGCAGARHARRGASGGAARRLDQPFRFELAQEALEQPEVSLLVVLDLYDHVLGDPVEAIAELDDPAVVLDRALLGLDNTFDYMHDV